MFLCKQCTIDPKNWVFDFKTGASFGPCESCGETRKCVDQNSSCAKHFSIKENDTNEKEIL